MSVVLIGSVSSSWHTLRAMIDNGIDVAGVCGLNRRHAETVSDYRDLEPLAGEHSIEFVAFDKVTEPAVVELIRRGKPELLFVVGLSQLVPAAVRDLAPKGAVGFHPTMLPRMRGRAPVAWTILLNEQPAVSLFFLTDEADAGDLIIQQPVALLPDDYASDLIERTNQVLERCIAELAPVIRAGLLPRKSQDHTKATWLPKRTREDGRIDFGESADQVYRLIRAASRPYPGAFTLHRDCEMIVWRGRLTPDQERGGQPGQIVDVQPGQGLLVQAGRGQLWLTELQYVGRPGPSDLGVFQVGQMLGP